MYVTLFLAVVFVSFWYYAVTRRHRNFPPGPQRIPLFGNYLQLLLYNCRYFYKGVERLTHKYKSKIIGLYLGSYPTVVVCDYDGIKEASSKPEFQGRAMNFLTKERALGRDLGVFFVDGFFWEEQRKFSLRYMRDFGYGRRSDALESCIEEEITDLLDLLNGSRKDEEVFRDGLACLPDVFVAGFTNIFLSILVGERQGRGNDALLRRVSRGAVRFVRSADATGGLLAQQPWLRYIVPSLSGYKDAIEGNDVLLDFVRAVLKEHKSSFSQECNRSFTDIYTKELKSLEGCESPSTFSDDQLTVIALDFLLPASSSQSTTMTFILVYMLHHPEIQEKVQKELDTVVGRNRLPTLNDRSRLPYTEATVREAMRRQTLAPLSVMHRATEDTEFRGYSIPKNTLIILCLRLMHMDKDIWGDPEVFRPERFLNEDGSLKKKDFSLPFGAGKRLCPGETFSRQNLFLTFASVMQNFTINMPDGKSAPAIDEFVPGIIETPLTFWVKFEPRK